jgi:hypothetical protein
MSGLFREALKAGRILPDAQACAVAIAIGPT